jgi:hypothetical protein
MRIRIILIFAMLALAGAAATQTDSPPPPSATPSTAASDTVAVLIAQLDAPEFGVRQLAEKKLTDMGSSIEPELRDALKRPISDESRARIKGILARLDEAKDLHATITMHYANAPLMKILNDFASQAGSDLGIGDPAVANFIKDRVATVDLDNAGFWSAFRVITDASGLKPTIGQNGLTLAPNEGRAIAPFNFDNPLTKSTGGFLIVPVSCQGMRTIAYSDNRQADIFTLVINVVPEPKLHVLGEFGIDWMKECVDDKGNSLLAQGVDRRMMFPRMMPARGPRQWSWQLAVNFTQVPNMGTKIARLRGELNLSVQTRSQAFEINNVTRARGLPQGDGEMTVTVLSCSKTNMNYRFDLALNGAGINMNMPSVQEFINSAELLDDQGNVIPRQTALPMQRPDRPGFNLAFIYVPTNNTPAKLRWERTVEQKKLAVPFELDDLLLP